MGGELMGPSLGQSTPAICTQCALGSHGTGTMAKVNLSVLVEADVHDSALLSMLLNLQLLPHTRTLYLLVNSPGS